MQKVLLVDYIWRDKKHHLIFRCSFSLVDIIEGVLDLFNKNIFCTFVAKAGQQSLPSRRCSVRICSPSVDAFNATYSKLDGVAPLITDPPLTNSPLYPQKKSKEKKKYI